MKRKAQTRAREEIEANARTKVQVECQFSGRGHDKHAYRLPPVALCHATPAKTLKGFFYYGRYWGQDRGGSNACDPSTRCWPRTGRHLVEVGHGAVVALLALPLQQLVPVLAAFGPRPLGRDAE